MSTFPTGIDMNSLDQLTDRQATVLEVIAKHIEEVGYPPTIRELGDALGIRSTNGVNDHLKALEKKGYLTREDGKSRTMQPLFWPDGTPYESGSTGASSPADDGSIQHIPVVGRIAAGAPLTAIERSDERVAIGQGLLGRTQGEVFALRVKGDSMIDDGIFDGDYIFVRRQPDAPNGQIVAARIDGEATVKRLFKEGERVRLQPANEAMEPIYVHADEARQTVVIGPVVGVFRRV